MSAKHDRFRATFTSEEWTTYNREKKRKYALAHPERNRLQHKRANLRAYSLTLEAFQQMVKDQDGKCASCEEVMSQPCVDHDHSCCPKRKTSCGKCVRALLCHACNKSLGLLRESPSRIRRLLQYVEDSCTTSVNRLVA